MRRRGWRRGNRPRKPSVRSPGRDWATCRARQRCQVSGRAWGERKWEGRGKHWPAPRRSRLLPTVRREEHVDHASPMCGRMARATRPRMRGTGAGDGGSRGAGAGGKLGASGGRVTGRSLGCEEVRLFFRVRKRVRAQRAGRVAPRRGGAKRPRSGAGCRAAARSATAGG